MYVLKTVLAENNHLVNQITFEALEDLWEHVNSLCYTDNVPNPLSPEILLLNLMLGKPSVLTLKDHNLIAGEINVVNQHIRRNLIQDQFQN